MINWNFNPAEYDANSFAPIPAGDHRARISEVEFKQFKSGNEGFEITLDISGHGGKLWYYLVLDPSDTKKTNQRVGAFFDSFGITDYNLTHFPAWKGKIGAVRVRHEEFNGSTSAKVGFCLSKKNQEKLAPWKESGGGNFAAAAEPVNISASDLPFDM